MTKKMLKVSIKTTTFAPVEIEVEGEVYRKEMITPKTIREIMKHEGKANEGDIDSVIMQLHLMTGVPVKIADQIDIRDLNVLVDSVSQLIFNPKKYEPEGEEKNVSRPEQKESP